MIRSLRPLAALALLTHLLTYSVTAAQGQTPKTYTSSEILLGLKKLNVLGSVMYLAAHPDDENTRLIAYLANERLLDTGYLSCTRGDGGQNLVGPELGEGLGVIRTQELLADRRLDGGRQFFTRANDFGFSKTANETFRIWDKKQVLADMVWVIRQHGPCLRGKCQQRRCYRHGPNKACATATPASPSQRNVLPGRGRRLRTGARSVCGAGRNKIQRLKYAASLSRRVTVPGPTRRRYG